MEMTATNPILTVLGEGLVPAAIVGALLLIMVQWIPRHSHWRVLLIALMLALVGRYVGWRVFVTLPSPENPIDFVTGLVFLAIELIAVAGTVLTSITLTRSRSRTQEVEANRDWLAAQEPPPLVDVFICTYNEEREILEKTMIGALGMAYPNYRVWVLDDGCRDWLAELSGSLGCHYLARPGNDHAKAGNINHGFRHVMALEERPDFISILDADFVPLRSFLSRAMTLFRETDVGIVQTPQHFINPDPIQANLKAADVWPDEQRYFFDVLMPAKDAWGTAFCCGTSSVVRTSALLRSGGLPTHSVTEDYLLTLRLKRLGYRTVYLNERLSLGLAPEGLKEYVTQRSRWCLGFAQILRSRDGPFAPGNGLFMRDRAALLESAFFWFGTFAFRFASIIVPILYLLLDIHAVNVGTVDALRFFFPYFLSQVIVMSWLSGRRVLPVMTEVTHLLAAREILAAFAVGLIRPKGHRFAVTAKGGDRSKTVVQWRMISRFGFLLALTVASVMYAFGQRESLQDSSVIALYWCWYNIIVLVVAMVVCVETPRQRRSERLNGVFPVKVAANGRSGEYHTADVSLGGVRLVGAAPAPVGAEVTLEIENARLHGRIARRSRHDFAIAIDAGLRAQTTMMRIVYSNRLRSPLSQIRPRLIAGKLVARIFA